MVLEYLVGNIQQVVRMRPKRKLEELEAKGLAKAVLEGLSFMHEMGRAHSGTYVVDIYFVWLSKHQNLLSRSAYIKSNNILVHHNDGDTWISNHKPKLCDLGDSVQVEPTTNHVVGHPAYRAPEVNLGLTWTTAVDIWSFGATVWRKYFRGRYALCICSAECTSSIHLI
jgi:serine/threonine protein kinase